MTQSGHLIGKIGGKFLSTPKVAFAYGLSQPANGEFLIDVTFYKRRLSEWRAIQQEDRLSTSLLGKDEQ